jgi:hypothetical protein
MRFRGDRPPSLPVTPSWHYGQLYHHLRQLVAAG